MKHRLTLIAVMIMAVAMPQVAKAYDFSAPAPSGQTLYYNIVNGEAQVTFDTVWPQTLSGNVVIPSTVTDTLTGITYSVTSIGDHAFQGCSITALTLPESVTSIGSHAFDSCVSLSMVTLPDAVTNIADSAFANCHMLVQVTLGRHLNYIGNAAFAGDTSIAALTARAVIPPFMNSLAWPFAGVDSTIAVTVPCGSVEDYQASNGWSRFTNISDTCTGLYDFSAVATSGQRLYYNIIADDSTDHWVTLTYPNYHLDEETNAVDYWYGYAKPAGALIIPDSVEYDSVRYRVYTTQPFTFHGCQSLVSVSFPNAMAELNSCVFVNCTSLAAVVLPDGLTEIPYFFFGYCQSLTSVNIPASVTRIGTFSFYGCSALFQVTLPEGLTCIDTSAFALCTNLYTVDIPSTVTEIGSWAFYNDSHLSTITLPEGMTYLAEGLFNRCANLTSVTLPSTLKRFDSGPFWGCSALTDIIVPDSVTVMGPHIFGNCTSLQHVDLPQSLTTIGESAFWACISLDSIVFPDQIRTLGRNLMDSCLSLTYCHLPDSLEFIDTSLFRLCTALPAIDLPQRISRINGWAFTACSSLETITVPESVTSIGDYGFYNNGTLATVHLPATLASLGKNTFAYCTAFDTLWVDATTPPSCFESTFYRAHLSNSVLMVPCNSEEAYRSHPYWGQFANITTPCLVGIDNIDADAVSVAVLNGQIVINGAEGDIVTLFDLAGRTLAAQQAHGTIALDVPANGVYLLQIGSRPARKIAVIQ